MTRRPVVAFIAALVLFTAPRMFAQAPAGEHNCPATTAIPPYVGPGNGIFSPNQNLCLPQLAPLGGPQGPLSFIVGGSEPGVRVDSQGTVYGVSIRGVPGGIDLWRWFATADGPPNANGTLPFKYEGQPDNCGILSNGCANNVGSATNLGLAPGGGDADIAVNAAGGGIPNVAVTSLSLAPGVTATSSGNRGDSFFNPPNVVAALIPGDDRQWQDAIGPATVYLSYHDAATFNIDVQRSNDGGLTYVDGIGEAIDPQTFPTAGGGVGSGNIAGQLHIDQSSCSSGGNLYSIFVAPDNATENAMSQPMRSVYVAASDSAKLRLPVFLFTDHKVYTSPAGSPGAVNGTNQIFPAMATDKFGYVYAVWSDQTNIYYSSSSDQGTTWTSPVRVNSGGTVGKANVFPWVAADANGHVVVTWIGANKAGNSNDVTVMEPTCSDGTNSCWAQWNVYLAETVNGHELVPNFTQYTASDHVIHLGTVSTGGLGGSANRNLGDFFQVGLDGQHRANIAFSDDHVVSPVCTTQTPGHCNSTDPQSFRNGQPYFTYQLAANPAIATTGSCAGTATPPPGEEKVSGHGQINSLQAGSSASFGLMAQNQPANAALSYQDAGAPSGALDVRSSNITVPAVNFSGSCVSVSGSAKVNKQPGYSYTVQACDNGNPGAGNDTFSINVSGPNFSYSNSGTITSGNIQVQSQ
jgi:hypothetical protein